SRWWATAPSARDASRRPVARGAGCWHRSRGHTARRRARWRSPFSCGCRGSSPSRKRLAHPTCSTTRRPERSSSRTTTWRDSKRPFHVVGRARASRCSDIAPRPLSPTGGSRLAGAPRRLLAVDHDAHGHGSSRRRKSQAEAAAELGEGCLHLGVLRSPALAHGRIVEILERVDGEAAVAAGARPEDEHRVDETLVAEPEVEALEHPRRVREVFRIAVEVVEEKKPVPRVHLL